MLRHRLALCAAAGQVRRMIIFELLASFIKMEGQADTTEGLSW